MSVEIDWIAAWYGVYAAWDATINFWLTGTFAVIVAVHALGKRATKPVTRLVASLYGAFSVYTLMRSVAIGAETFFIAERIESLGISSERVFFSDFGWYADYLMLGIFMFGSVATVVFVVTAPGRTP